MNSVKHFMIDKGWQQADLAKRLDIHYSHVSLLLSGKRYPSVPLLLKLSKVTKIPVETLLSEVKKTPKNKRKAPAPLEPDLKHE